MKRYALFFAAIAAFTLSACGGGSRTPAPMVGTFAGSHGEVVLITISLDQRAYGTVWLSWQGQTLFKAIAPETTAQEVYESLAFGGYAAWDSIVGATATPFRTEWHFYGDPNFLEYGASGVGVEVEVRW